MNIVLYTTDFEPITIVELPVWLLEEIERKGGIGISVQKSKEVIEKEVLAGVFDPNENLIVTIYCEKLRWRDDTLKTILVTPNDELALTLRPEWLPGQQSYVNELKLAIKDLTERLIKLGKQS
jgi:hypothetical protein